MNLKKILRNPKFQIFLGVLFGIAAFAMSSSGYKQSDVYSYLLIGFFCIFSGGAHMFFKLSDVDENLIDDEFSRLLKYKVDAKLCETYEMISILAIIIVPFLSRVKIENNLSSFCYLLACIAIFGRSFLKKYYLSKGIN